MFQNKFRCLLKKGENVDEAEVTIQLNKDLQAPVQKGDVVGHLLVEKQGETLIKTDLTAAETIETASWWELFKRSLSTFAGK